MSKTTLNVSNGTFGDISVINGKVFIDGVQQGLSKTPALTVTIDGVEIDVEQFLHHPENVIYNQRVVDLVCYKVKEHRDEWQKKISAPDELHIDGGYTKVEDTGLDNEPLGCCVEFCTGSNVE